MKPNFALHSGFTKFLLVLLLSLSASRGTKTAQAQSTYEPYAFNTLAGVVGFYDVVDGAGSFARFTGPNGIAVDSAGNIYVGDADNHTIRKLTPGGVVTTLAGMAGVPGSADGTGSAARFNLPYGVAVDSAGNVYVADRNNHTIRKITSAGVVGTLAGMAGVAGSADGTGSAAQFNLPAAVAVDGAGNIYVADAHNYTIRKITPGGVVSTVAGMAGVSGSTDGTGGAARFNFIDGIAVDSAGSNVYAADTANHTIRKIAAGGVVTTLAGLAGASGSTDGVGSAARFNDPWGLAVDSTGNLYVADEINHTVRKITSGGMVSTLAGLAGSSGSADGTGSAAQFYYPIGAAVDGAGNVYIADGSNFTIRKITSGGVVSTLAGLAGNGGSADGSASMSLFNTPYGIAVDSSRNLYVADTYNHVIRKMTSGGATSILAGSVRNSGSTDGTGSAARFSNPIGIAVDTTGNVYVADEGTYIIRKVTPGGVVSTIAGLAGEVGSADGMGSAARFNTPYHLAVDTAANVYVADTYNHTIRKITPAGVVSTLAGLAGSPGSANGTGSGARFNLPEGITADTAGNVFVADTFNHTIRKITPAGVVSTLAGLAGSVGSTDGTGSAARFYFPYDLGIDTDGYFYVGEANQTLRKITSGGVVTTIAGSAGVVGSADGIGTAARFNYPRGIAVEKTFFGFVYAADNLNHTIRRIVPFSSGALVTTIGGLAGSPGSADGTGGLALFRDPEGITADNAGNLYVADSTVIRKISSSGIVSTLAGEVYTGGAADGTGSAAVFDTPIGMAVDGAGNVYVSDYEACTIRKVTPGGLVTTLAGVAFTPGSTDGTGSGARFHDPKGLAIDSAGNLFVGDTSNHTIRKITPAGVVSTLAGLAGSSGSVDGTGNLARFDHPFGVTVDTVGNLYVADSFNNTIRKITPGGVVSTLAGQAGAMGSGDGMGSAARFYLPYGLSSDRAGNIYVADRNNYTIRKVTPAGVVTTLGGLANNTGSADGTGSTARFSNPFGVASDRAGNIYVADTFNYTIRGGVPAVQLGGTVSHKLHGGAAFDIGLMQTGAAGIECRAGAIPGAHQVIMSFVKPVTLTSATVTPDPLAVGATGAVGSFSVNGGLVTLNLTNVSNAQTIIVTLGVTDGTNSSNVSIPMGVLAGDISGNGSVNASDVSLTKSKSGQPVDGTNYRADVTVNGAINASDVAAVKAKSGTALP